MSGNYFVDNVLIICSFIPSIGKARIDFTEKADSSKKSTPVLKESKNTVSRSSFW